MSAAAASTRGASTGNSTTTPLFDACLDVPHPAASAGSPPVRVLASTPEGALPAAGLVQQVQQFAFPEYDARGQATLTPPAAQHYPRPLNRYDQYAMQPKSFTSFTCTLQQADGTRVYGHVRRSLPISTTTARYDVGRRGERAWIVLTRRAGAEGLFAAILKSLDAITAQQAALPPKLRPHGDPQAFFLHSLTAEHDRLSQWYNSAQAQAGKPLVAVLSGLELGVTQPRAMYRNVDAHKFLLPTSVLRQDDPTRSASPILPLLRCVGVAHTLRILTALLSERRVIFCSASATRLSACSHAALAMLQCGNLTWQHLYIPVLPPHLHDYLAAPYPYVIGILSSAWPALERRSHELGQCLQIFLDRNQMRVLGAEGDLNQSFPDLLMVSSQMPGGVTMPNVPNVPGTTRPPPTAAEVLAQDLVETLKVDKRTLYGVESGNAVLNNVGETAGKAAKAIKSGFSKLRARVKNVGRGDSFNEEVATSENETSADDPAVPSGDTNAGDYIFTEGCHNEVAEEEVRLSFTAFFLSLTGDLRWFLSVPGPGQTPILDRKRYLQLRGQTEPEGSPVHYVLQNFCQTQMLEEFAKQQVAHIQSRAAVTADSSLFDQCAAYNRKNNLDFGIQNLRQVSRQIAQANPGRLTGLVQTNARRMAMTLTSNKTFEGDSARAISQLVEECRESSSVLLDVMSVVWLRLRDSKGMQWKHALQALQILKNLLYHGPLAAVSEATDGLDKIRSFKFYENMRQAAAQDIRNTATLVYNLLVDRSRLFSIRRVCAERRRQLEQGPMGPKATAVLKFGTPFAQMHTMLHPMAQGTVVRMPGSGPTAPPAPTKDLFGLTAAAPVGAPPPQPAPPQPSSQANVVDLFDSFAVSTPAQTPVANAAAASNPFSQPQPTMVTMPPKPQPPNATPPHTSVAPAFAQPAPPAFAQPPQGQRQDQHFLPQHQGPHVTPPPPLHQGQAFPPHQQYPGQSPHPTFVTLPPHHPQSNPFASPPPQKQFDPFS